MGNKKKTRFKGRSGAVLLLFLIIVAGKHFADKRRITTDSTPVVREETSATPYSADEKEADTQPFAIDEVRKMLPRAITSQPEQMLTRKAYVVSYNRRNLQPNYVAWMLTADHTFGTVKRPGSAFREDKQVAEPRATLSDYRNSGYARGHICPAGDNKWDEQAMRESFLLTNMCPQNPKLNSGDWNEIENACRQWAKKWKKVWIVSGPVFLKQRHETIGANKIPVPEAFFKVVLRLGDHPAGIAFICRNTEGNRKKDQYVNSIDQVERITGYDFFYQLPDDVEQQVESRADIAAW